MKKITALLLKVSLVLSGLMIITDHVGATKRDVETALSLIQQARTAIGGDDAIRQVQSLGMKGRSTRTLQVEGEPERQINGEFEIALMQPDRMFQIEKLGDQDSTDLTAPGEKTEKMSRVLRVETSDRMKVEGNPEEPKNLKVRHDDDFTRYMVSLLLTAPESSQVTFDYVGEGDVDGARADIVSVSAPDGSIMRLYLDKQSHLPLMMVHQGFDLPPMLKIRLNGGPGTEESKVMISKLPGDDSAGDGNVMIKRRSDDETSSGEARVLVFKQDGAGSADGSSQFRVAFPAPKEVEIQTRFSNYRAEGGIMLPHRLTRTINGKQTEVLTVDSYEINSPDTADKFGPGKLRIIQRSKDQ